MNYAGGEPNLMIGAIITYLGFWFTNSLVQYTICWIGACRAPINVFLLNSVKNVPVLHNHVFTELTDVQDIYYATWLHEILLYIPKQQQMVAATTWQTFAFVSTLQIECHVISAIFHCLGSYYIIRRTSNYWPKMHDVRSGLLQHCREDLIS